MQAGFALLTCGLVRKKNVAHLMMLNFAAYVFAFLAYYAVGFAFQFGAVAVNAAPSNIGGTPTLNHFLIGSGQWGWDMAMWILPGRLSFMRSAAFARWPWRSCSVRGLASTDRTASRGRFPH